MDGVAILVDSDRESLIAGLRMKCKLKEVGVPIAAVVLKNSCEENVEVISELFSLPLLGIKKFYST